MLKLLRSAFMAGVSSVLPHNLIRKILKVDNNSLIAQNKIYKLHSNVYLYGFGKAVIGMVKPVQDMLTVIDGNCDSHLVSAIISVPTGIKNTIAPELYPTENNGKIKILEGALNNIPDENAFRSAQMIVSSLESLKCDDLAVILISGGGSALLPYPVAPMTLQDKIEVINKLSTAGADIVELNTVRKAISETKGGRLVHKTKAQILCLILSDVIGSPLDIIASGPTVYNSDKNSDALDIMAKYNLQTSERVKEVVCKETDDEKSSLHSFLKVQNIIMGDNKLALNGCQVFLDTEASCNHETLVLTSKLCGNVTDVANAFASLSVKILKAFNKKENLYLCEDTLSALSVENVSEARSNISSCISSNKTLFLLFGGETTVRVVGDGKGGRNQELVLLISKKLNDILQDDKLAGGIFFLSAGTDGIDGPTDSAGATTYWTSDGSLYEEAMRKNINLDDFLKRNDSYNFFCSLNNGKYLVSPGHTGTNVMDLMMIAITPTI